MRGLFLVDRMLGRLLPAANVGQHGVSASRKTKEIVGGVTRQRDSFRRLGNRDGP
jgi:hypothetical protein